MDIDSLLPFLIDQAEQWIDGQRQVYWPAAAPIPGQVIAEVAPYFSAATLAAARVFVVDRLSNPPFYAALRQYAPQLPLIDFGDMDGITFNDTIVVGRRGSVPNPASLLFHELVHVVQYAQLGVSEFTRRYVRGWASNGLQYASIPLEVDAYALQDRFDRGEASFSVEEAVARQLASRPAT